MDRKFGNKLKVLVNLFITRFVFTLNLNNCSIWKHILKVCQYQNTILITLQYWHVFKFFTVIFSILRHEDLLLAFELKNFVSCEILGTVIRAKYISNLICEAP